MATMQQAEGGDGNQTATNKTNPGRQPSDKTSVTNKLDQTGSSAAGSKKMEQNNMKTRSMGNFSGYPYVIEPRGVE